MIAELQKRTREYFEDDTHTAFDYALEWVERGRTLTALAQSVTMSVNGYDPDGPLVMKAGLLEVSRPMIDKYLREIAGDQRVSDAFSRARKTGAHGLVEDGLATLDNGSDERDTANANRLRLEARERLAAAWNREDFAKAGNTTNVMLSFGALHLDALRHVAASARLLDAPEHEPAQPDVEILPSQPDAS